MRILRILLKAVARSLATIAIVAVCAALLIRAAPGFDVDERELDAKLGRDSQDRIRAERAQNRGIFQFLQHFAERGLHGDFGTSIALHQPVSVLVPERARITFRELGWGLTGAAALAVLLAMAASLSGSAALAGGLRSLNAFLLCLPAAVLGYAALWLRLPAAWTLGATVLPHLFQYFFHLLQAARQNTHLLAASARGVSRMRINVVHTLLPCLPEGAAAIGMGASVAFGASIPIEFATGVPGLGQLAWQAALSRDLPVLFVITILAASLVVAINAAADFVRACFASEGMASC